MSYYFLIEEITRRSERAVQVQPTANGSQPNPAQWIPKSVIGIWDHAGQLIMGVDDFFRLPETADNWQQCEMTAGEIVEMRRTAEAVNLYNHMEKIKP